MMQYYAKLNLAVPAKKFKHVIALLFIILMASLSPVKLFAQRPAITSFSPSAGPVGTLVTINGSILAAPAQLTIGGQSAIVVSNTGSVLVAMVMPGAVSGAVSLTSAS